VSAAVTTWLGRQLYCSSLMRAVPLLVCDENKWLVGKAPLRQFTGKWGIHRKPRNGPTCLSQKDTILVGVLCSHAFPFRVLEERVHRDDSWA
jgi:hypothetical protein